MGQTYKHKKKGAGRHVQLPEWVQATTAWATMAPGPRALYIELKRRYNGANNGGIILSHRDAAALLNVHRNTVGPWFAELQDRGFIFMAQAPHLGPSGIGKASIWGLTEVATPDSHPARKDFVRWQPKQKPRTKTRTPRHNGCDTSPVSRAETGKPVLKIVT